jgi:hypothetical protein
MINVYRYLHIYRCGLLNGMRKTLVLCRNDIPKIQSAKTNHRHDCKNNVDPN